VKHSDVSWVPDEGTFVARGSRPEHSISMAAPREGRPASLSGTLPAMTPTEVMLGSIGGCTAWDVVEILRKQRQPVTAVSVRVEGSQAEDPPWPFTRIVLRFRVTGHRIDRDAVERAVKLSSEKYCSALATVRGVAEVETEIEILEAPPEQSLPGDPATPAARG
jgi:putative redox protein